MIAELNYPVKSLKGKLGKQYYARVQYGKTVIQRRPKRDKPPTEAQKRPVGPSLKSTQGSIDDWSWCQFLFNKNTLASELQK